MIETERLILRKWRDSDLPDFAKMNADIRVMKFFPAPLSRIESDNLANKLIKHFDENNFTFFATEIKKSAKFIGFIGLYRTSFEAHFTPCVEIGWRLSYDHWGEGYSTEGAKAAMLFGFNNICLKEIVSITSVPNTRSRRVMEKLGMTHNPDEDFNHPKVQEGHQLQRHVLYRKKA